MPDPTSPQPITTPAAAGLPAAAALSEKIGADHTTSLVRGGAEHLAETFPGGIPASTTAEEIAAAVLLGAMGDFTRGEIEGGLLEGARAAIRDAELATLADVLRAAYRAAKSTPDNPLQGLIDLADAAEVDLSDSNPAPVQPDSDPPDGELEHLATVIAEARLAGIHAGGYTLARRILATGYSRAGRQDRRVYAHDEAGRTAYRFVAPGVLVTGDATVGVSGDRVDLEQTAGGETFRAAGMDEVGAILALIARQQGLAAVFLPADTVEPPALSERKDPAYALIFAAVTGAGGCTGRILPLADRTAITAQVYRDLRADGVIK